MYTLRVKRFEGDGCKFNTMKMLNFSGPWTDSHGALWTKKAQGGLDLLNFEIITNKVKQSLTILKNVEEKVLKSTESFISSNLVKNAYGGFPWWRSG